jgi:hypothetical protein
MRWVEQTLGNALFSAIEGYLPFNFAIVFSSIYFRFRSLKQNELTNY